MKKTIFKIIKYSLLLGISVFSFFLFVPKQYEVLKFKERPNTKYWNLSTGSKIGYTFIEGNSSKERSPIIYLHGGPGGQITDAIIDFYRPLAEEGHDLYFYDQIGSGQSERLENIEEYSVNRHQKDLVEIIEKIDSEKVILFGQSWGAMLAMEYFSDYKDEVERLILTGPGPILPINFSLSKLKTPDSLNLKKPKYSNQEANAKVYTIRSKMMRYFASVFKKKLTSDQEADDFFTQLNSELKRSTICDGSIVKPSEGGGGYYAHVMTAKSFYQQKDKRSKIKDSQIPTLIIKGQCDNQNWGFTNEYLDLLPNVRLEIVEGAGHSMVKENQKIYLDLIIEFMSD